MPRASYSVLIRANSLGFRVMASRCAENFGAYSVCSLSRASFLSVLTRLKNTLVARSSSWPLFSIATMVFWKVGASGLLAIASISRSCCAMPASKAGAKSLS
ncbi:MAG: hypothetical protein ABS98_12610 [Lysobacteraceae bacterium SCN 69-48]|nr:MAG: hypothetical protein ABS98_12610 [Xanthomonadaceae bacterium SCN 69-48]